MEKKINLVFYILIIIFSISLVEKQFQNDTFFTIAIGTHYLENGLTSEDPLTWHEGLTNTNPRWLFDVIITAIYQVSSFSGIYIFSLIITALIGIMIFYLLQKTKSNTLISFVVTLVAMYFSKYCLTARGQIMSYLLFLLEIYFIEMAISTFKKRYYFYLILDSILLINFHASLWPMFFVLFLPYIAECFGHLFKIHNFSKKLYAEQIPIYQFLVVIVVSFFAGFLNPLMVTPWKYLVNDYLVGTIATNISELQPVKLIENPQLLLVFVIYLLIFSYQKSKIKVSDLCMFLGLGLMSLISLRNGILFYLLGSVSLARLLTSIDYANEKLNRLLDVIEKKKIYLILLSIVIVNFALYTGIHNINFGYVDDTKYPVEATEYIKENIDIGNMRIFNHYDNGSYLELNGIPAFIDSRAEIFCDGNHILLDYNKVMSGAVNYWQVFEQYDITHVLLYNTELINQYIFYDDSYELIYKDDIFSFYQKID